MTSEAAKALCRECPYAMTGDKVAEIVIDYVLDRIRQTRADIVKRMGPVDPCRDEAIEFWWQFSDGERYGADRKQDVAHRPLGELTTDQLLAELHARGVLRFSNE